MAIKGALTTPGSSAPIAILDMGAGSTDASVLHRDGTGRSVHLAGAGNMVTLMIQSELGLDTTETAENVKRYPLARVETLFHIRHETAPSSSSTNAAQCSPARWCCILRA